MRINDNCFRTKLSELVIVVKIITSEIIINPEVARKEITPPPQCSLPH